MHAKFVGFYDSCSSLGRVTDEAKPGVELCLSDTHHIDMLDTWNLKHDTGRMPDYDWQRKNWW